MNAIGQLAHGAFHFGVAFVTNHDELVAFFVQLGDFDMHLGDQGAGGIKNSEAARLRFGLNRFAHTMRTENQGGPWRYIAQFFNEDGAFGFEIVDHIGVVHNFMAYINGPAKFGNGRFHNVDGTVDAGTKATRLSQKDFFHAHICFHLLEVDL